MLDKIIAFSIKNKFIVALMTLLLVIWGVWSATQLPIDAVPDITNNQVQIITICPTLAGQEVEQFVTYPIEQSLANLPDLLELRSISRFGLSVITVVFEEKVDVYFARQLINEKLQIAQKEIPEGMGTPELGPVSTGLGEIYQYILHPKKGSEDKYSPMELRTMQDWIVARQLMGTPGVAEINSFGGELKQYEVALDPNQLLAMNVSIPEVFTALEKNNENTGGAYIDKKPNAYFIRSVGLISSFEDIKNIVVKTNPNGIPILIKDIGEVQLGGALRYGALTYNGELDAVGGMVLMLKGANSAEVVKDVKEKMQTIQTSLPEDIILEPFLDRTNLVDRAISTVESNLIEGALIVIFVLVVFLGNFRAGLIVASAIPLSLLFALGMMRVFGLSANLMSLGAIDFGLIVDGAVIIVEATLHHLGLRKGMQKLTQEEMDEEVYQSASKIRSSAAFGEIIILIVYLPILSLIGIEGKMFRPMAMTVGFAIFGALILSLTYIPMMCAAFLPKKISNKKNFSDKIMDFLYQLYQPFLELAIRAKTIVVPATLVVLLVSVFLFSRIGGEFIPKLQEGDFAFHCILPQGSSLTQSVETSMLAARIIKTFDEVEMVVNKTGSAEVPTDPMPPEATDMMIILKDKNDWERKISYDELADEIIHALEEIPGIFFEKNQPIQMRFNELMTGIRQDVAIKIFGENMDTLLAYANKVDQLVQQVDGSSAPMVERVEGLPQIVIDYNRSQIANYGLNIQDINHIISTSFAGGVAGQVFEDERKFDLVVRLKSVYRQDIENVEQLFIPLPNGAQIPLSQVAKVSMKIGPAQISREDGKRRIVVGFNVTDRDVESVVQDIQVKLEENVKLPLGYYYTFGGTFENLQAASKRLKIAVPIALVLIFVLLYFTFNSIKQALLIFTAIPMSAIGGIFALLIRDMPFSISAGIGFIALFGVAVLNGIVLIGTFNNLKKEGMENALDRVREGTKIRLRPVLMTAMVASLGFLPMALSQGAGAEVQKPLATVVIGGLISATFLTLFVLPLLYLMFDGKRLFLSNKLATLSLLALLPFLSQAQNTQVLSVEKAVEIALEHNQSIQAENLNIQAAEKGKKTVFDLPKTAVDVQYGQFNTKAMDNSFQVSQEIPFPTVFSAKSKLIKAQIEDSKLHAAITNNQVKMEVRSRFYEIFYLEKTNRYLNQVDSILSSAVEISTLKYTTGAIPFIETQQIKNKQFAWQIKLMENTLALENAIQSFQIILGIDADFQLSMDDYETALSLNGQESTQNVTTNPNIQAIFQKAVIKDTEARLAKARILPDLKIGYFNQSIIGFQNTDGIDVFYDGKQRFQVLQIGVNVPLTFINSAAKVKQLQLEQQAIVKQANYATSIMAVELQNLLRKEAFLRQSLALYSEGVAANNIDMYNSTIVSYRAGDINYLELLQVVQNTIEMKIEQLKVLNGLNQTVIQINYLTQQ